MMTNEEYIRENLTTEDLAEILVRTYAEEVIEYDWDEEPYVEGFKYIYATSDGEEFDDLEDAIKHEKQWLSQEINFDTPSYWAFSRKQNEELVEQYPFLKPYDPITGGFLSDYDYAFTALDDMPKGWRSAFGKQMCEEIREELVKEGKLDKYRVDQVKEKYGQLRWYDHCGTEKIEKEIIPKYEKLSAQTCVVCGNAAATNYERGHAVPLCEKCAKGGGVE